MIGIELAERGWLPDALVRRGIRRLLRRRLEEESAGDVEAASRRFAERIDALRESRIAIETDAANAQHYEVPADFYRLVLGPRLKYSSAFWPDGVEDLAAAEEAMLERTAEHAGLADGQRVLELGCGWGSLTLWMAERFPNSRILGVSNSASQRASILADAHARGLFNVDILTRDVNDLSLERTFDRVVSVEMFEH
ncbi:MAG: class I SAM-dependent methyltransferase, partial [Wenzhouxiangellaceae bacterium]|nr:class I SAM-dependent methyltransferase [Wenzhouxiangellaceae bacterium]